MARQKERLRRELQIRFGIFLYVLRRLVPLLLALCTYMVIATIVLRWDLTRAGQSVDDFQATLFSIFTLLSFEPSQPFPVTRIARVIYWLTPVMGIFLIAEGLLKVGASLFDPKTRRDVWVSIMTDQLRGHVVVCGLGHVGFRIVQELHRLGEDIVVLEQHDTSPFVESVRSMGIAVHVGDGRRDDLLASTGIKRAKAVVCATSDDLANLEIALDAKRMNPNIRVVMRMFEQRLASKVGGALDLDESFSTSALSAPLIALQATQDGIRSAYRLDDIVRVTAEINVAQSLEPTTVANLEAIGTFRIVSIRRKNGPSFISAKTTDKVGPGDILIVDTTAVDLPSVRFRIAGE